MPAVSPTLAPVRLGAPCRVPARTVRVGVVPRPRLRPLHEVLAAIPAPSAPTDVPPTPTPGPDDGALAALEALTAAARPAARSLFGMLAEVLDGRRPAVHLRSLCEDELYTRVVAPLAPGAPSAGRPPGRVRGIRVCAVTPSAAEVSAVVERDGRARALAGRLERSGRRWWLTALVVG